MALHRNHVSLLFLTILNKVLPTYVILCAMETRMKPGHGTPVACVPISHPQNDYFLVAGRRSA